MYVCQSCGVNLPKDASFCPNCGVQLSENNVGEAPVPLEPTGKPVVAVEPYPEEKPKKRKWRPNIAYFLFMFPALVVVAFLVLVIVALSTDPVSEVNVRVEMFQEGLLPVQMGDGNSEPLWGYIDQNGSVVIKPQFTEVSEFGENGMAAVCTLGKWGYVNRNGQFVIEPVYEDARGFGERGFAPVKINGVWGYIDEAGSFVINPQFDSAEPFTKNGLALVEIGGRYGYIDRNGVYVIPPQYEDARSFGLNGQAAIFAFGKWGMINKKGEYVFNPQFDALYPFANNGLALVEQDGAYGYIDRSGMYVIRPVFEEATSFDDNGLALVKQNGKYGYINGECHFVIEAGFDLATPFSADSGLAAVCKDAEKGLWGYIGYDGRFALEPVYLSAGAFRCGVAVVQDGEGIAYIDKSGEEVFRPDADCLSATCFTEDGYAVLVYQDERGSECYEIVNTKGEPLGKMRYSMLYFDASKERIAAK